ncbi:MAG TPA: hypothetical protein VEI55_03985, partial [Candidatus Acidoferrum sp.]|nr:hypothetical protein [Candidatus Acidoferrum sp.]
MDRNFAAGWCVLWIALGCAQDVRTQEVVDRIVARVENDIILLSELKALKQYQELVEGQSESDNVIVDRLIDQWVVRSEAQLSLFPEPKEAEIDR